MALSMNAETEDRRQKAEGRILTPDSSTPDSFPLGDEEIELISGIQRDGMILQGRLIGILDAFVKRNKLEGRWELAANGREIYRPGTNGRPAGL